LLLVGATGFLLEHPFLRAAASLSILPTCLFDAGSFRRHSLSFHLLKLLNQEFACQQSVPPLVPR